MSIKKIKKMVKMNCKVIKSDIENVNILVVPSFKSSGLKFKDFLYFQRYYLKSFNNRKYKKNNYFLHYF